MFVVVFVVGCVLVFYFVVCWLFGCVRVFAFVCCFLIVVCLHAVFVDQQTTKTTSTQQLNNITAIVGCLLMVFCLVACLVVDCWWLMVVG